MQVALPIAQPLSFPSYGVAAFMLTGLMLAPPLGHTSPVAEAKRLDEPIRIEHRDTDEKGLLNREKRSIVSEGRSRYTVEEARGSSQVHRGGLDEAWKGVQSTETSRGQIFLEPKEETRAFVVKHALSWLGVPYAWGGESRAGIDCSALVQSVYRSIGVEMPRTSYEQFRIGVGLPMEQLLPGDLVFFSTNGSGASHVGIYLGERKFISALRQKVDIQSLDTEYWKKAYRGSRRVIQTLVH